MNSTLCDNKNSVTKSGSQAGGLPSLDYSAISARKLQQSFLAKEQSDKAGITSRRVRRFYQRYFTGVGVGGRLRFLTLTSSDTAVAEGLDIHRSWRCLVMRLRRRLGAFEYIGVREIKGDRQHLHLVFRGSYIEQKLISAMWDKLHKSQVVFIEAVYKARGGANYLAKYICEQADNRYWCSYNWVFKGWCGWSKRVMRIVGNYPSKALLCGLARLDKDIRSGILAYWNSWLDYRAGWLGMKT